MLAHSQKRLQKFSYFVYKELRIIMKSFKFHWMVVILHDTQKNRPGNVASPIIKFRDVLLINVLLLKCRAPCMVQNIDHTCITIEQIGQSNSNSLHVVFCVDIENINIHFSETTHNWKTMHNILHFMCLQPHTLTHGKMNQAHEEQHKCAITTIITCRVPVTASLCQASDQD